MAVRKRARARAKPKARKRTKVRPKASTVCACCEAVGDCQWALDMHAPFGETELICQDCKPKLFGIILGDIRAQRNVRIKRELEKIVGSVIVGAAQAKAMRSRLALLLKRLKRISDLVGDPEGFAEWVRRVRNHIGKD